MSESAWGKVLYDKKAKKWKINCRNWECGILLPVPAEKLNSVRIQALEAKATAKKEREAARTDSETESDSEDDAQEAALNVQHAIGMAVFDELASLPFQYPARTYDGREPWYFKERPRETE